MLQAPPQQTAIAQNAPGPGPAGAGPANPFTKAAREHVEPIFDVAAGVPGASARQLGNGILEVPAYGYMRSLLFTVEATGGAAGAAVVAARADAPWSVIGSIALQDVNGQFIFGPYSGYEWMLVHMFGGGAFDADPTRSPAYSPMDANGNFKFALRLPVEITAQDALGALANQNSASTFKVQITLAPAADVYATAPATTVPSVRVRGFLEAWTQPATVDAFGTPNVQFPPALGTVQNWSKEDKAIAAGSQTPRLSRVGNAIRTVILVTKNAAGARITTMFPDLITINWDGRQLQTVSPDVLRHYMQERYGYTAAQLPAGVYVFEFTHDFDGHPGGENRNGYLNTTQASRIELPGQYGAAGTLTVLMNDVLAFADAAL